jgi:DNA-binding IclR family transcriptional regulator
MSQLSFLLAVSDTWGRGLWGTKQLVEHSGLSRYKVQKLIKSLHSDGMINRDGNRYHINALGAGVVRYLNIAQVEAVGNA